MSRKWTAIISDFQPSAVRWTFRCIPDASGKYSIIRLRSSKACVAGCYVPSYPPVLKNGGSFKGGMGLPIDRVIDCRQGGLKIRSPRLVKGFVLEGGDSEHRNEYVHVHLIHQGLKKYKLKYSPIFWIRGLQSRLKRGTNCQEERAGFQSRLLDSRSHVYTHIDPSEQHGTKESICCFRWLPQSLWYNRRCLWACLS